MTHLDRWKAAVGRGSYDRLPRFYLGTGEFTESLKAHGVEGLETLLYDRFDIDYRFQGSGMEGKTWEPEYIGPEPRRYEDGSFENIWGSRQRLTYYRDGRGAYTETFQYALGEAESVADVRTATAGRARTGTTTAASCPRSGPSPTTRSWWATCPSAGSPGRCVARRSASPTSPSNPAVGEAIIRHIADFGYEYFSRILETVKEHIGRNVVAIHIADDWGMQEGLLASPEAVPLAASTPPSTGASPTWPIPTA